MNRQRVMVLLLVSVAVWCVFGSLCVFRAAGYSFGTDPVYAAESDSSADVLVSGDYEYTVSDDGTAVIKKYNGTDTDVTVPGSLGGHKVTQIGSGAFSNNHVICSVVLPDSVTVIGYIAFLRCTSLTKVSLPDSIVTIDNNAFEDCTALEEFNFPEGLKTIGRWAFERTGIKRVILPASLEKIKDEAFMESAVEYVSFPGNSSAFVASNCPFQWCRKLTTVLFGKYMNDSEDVWFYGCPNLTRMIFLNNDPPRYYNYGSSLITPHLFGDCPNVTIYGYSGSWSQYYAEYIEYPFVALDGDEGFDPGLLEPYPAPDAEVVPAGVKVKYGYLPGPDEVYDGRMIRLLRSVDGGKYEVVLRDISLESFIGIQYYLDEDVKNGSTYRYAIQAYKGDQDGEISWGNSVTYRRSIEPDQIDVIRSIDVGLLPVANSSGTQISVKFTDRFTRPHRSLFTKNGLIYLFNGRIELSCHGSTLCTWNGKDGDITYSLNEDGTAWELIVPFSPYDIHAGSIPSNAKCELKFYDDAGELIGSETIKTSFERLSFRNSKEDIPDQAISKSMAEEVFGKVQGDRLYDNAKNDGKNLGLGGLCFGMSIVTDQVQSGMVPVSEYFGKGVLDDVRMTDTVLKPVGGISGRTLLDLVKRCQLYQHLNSVVQEMQKSNCDFKGLMRHIEKYRGADGETLMPMIRFEGYSEDKKDRDSHAVLAYDYRKNGDTLVIYVYEPGDPYGNIQPYRYITVTDASDDPKWRYQFNKNDLWTGSRSDGYRFSWYEPSWDIIDGPSDNTLDRQVLLTTGPFDDAWDYVMGIAARGQSADQSGDDITLSLIDVEDDTNTALFWVNGDGTIDLSKALSGGAGGSGEQEGSGASGSGASGSGERGFDDLGCTVSLYGNKYVYEISGASNLKLEMQEESGAEDGSPSVYGLHFTGSSPDSEVTVRYSYLFGGELQTAVCTLSGAERYFFGAIGSVIFVSGEDGRCDIVNPDGSTRMIEMEEPATYPSTLKDGTYHENPYDPDDPSDPSGPDDPTDPDDYIFISRIKISGISKKIAAGKKIKLKAVVKPANATDKTIAWISSDEKVATVNKKGLVTMKKGSGGKSVIITALSEDGSGEHATYRIRSMKGVVRSIAISGSGKVKAGKILKLKARVKATSGANRTLKWTTSNSRYATVTSKGLVKAKTAGKGKTVRITAMATDGSGIKKTVKIKIR